jgi:hypothetical protein
LAKNWRFWPKTRLNVSKTWIITLVRNRDFFEENQQNYWS